MSGGKRGRSELSPTLFPFLAVLLCTVGALVLILVLVVGQSQASVKEAIDNREQRADELRAHVETVREALREDREKIQLEIEKKRKSLEALEQQTHQLVKDLEQLDQTAKLAEQKLDDSASQEQIEQQLSELQKQLAQAAEKLKEKLAKPSGEKPIFAIIPYEGNHGTHRRPIYLECRTDGIVIQPEGVLIGLKDLKPPYGPGNPLDAALRAIRTHYAPGGGLNTSAYPLLVVRASGIRTYALARMAMAGWDDQFGYELVDDEMELAFPDGDPSLVSELERTLATARSRQAALVMAMPGRYRQAMEELSEDKLNFEEGQGGWGSGGGAESGAGINGGLGTGNMSPGSGQRLSDSAGTSISGARGGFAFAPDGSSIDPLASGGRAPHSPNSGSPNSGSGWQGFGTGGTTTSELNTSAANAGGSSQTFNGSPAGQEMTFAQGALGGNQFTRGSQAGSSQFNQPLDPNSGQGGGQMSQRSSDDTAGSTGTFRDAMNAARAKQDGAADPQSSLASTDVDQGTGGSQMAGANSEGFAPASSSASSSGAPGAESLSPSVEFSRQAKQNSEAVAKRKGRNWAWTSGPPRSTAVVRHVRLVCYEDRWVVLPDAGSHDKPTSIMLDVSLQSSAEQLAKVVADKMDRWGYALSGGYWKPVLQVEVADRGELRYQQLTRLLEGSGLEVQLLQPASSSSTPARK